MKNLMHQTIKCCLLILPLILLYSCSTSPEEEGKKLATRINENDEQFLIELQQAEAEFVKDFNASDYATRDDAYKDYDKRVADVIIDYREREQEISAERGETSLKYFKDKNTDSWSAFEAAFESGIDRQLLARVKAALKNTDYPASVVTAVRTVIPAKPNAKKIIADLQTTKIAEGFPKDKCWFSENQRWTLENYEIKDFKIEEVMADTNKDYVFVASMRLENDHNAFDARVKVSYILPQDEDWQMEFVNSCGLSIVRTHKYDDLVSYEIADDGWGGVKALQITNNSDVELVVGVDYVARGNRRRTAVLASPNKKAQVGGTFGGGSVTSYEIGFVERY